MQKNKNALLDSSKRVNLVKIYNKHNSFAKNGCPELTDWSTDDNGLFLLYDVRVLTCISKKATLDNNLIAA